ncbi:MAG: 2Fe-2S iron-sulfur cluster-binding protein [Gammaproteobacteria bacterium]|nr:2Fe-2S iron-sulfur cluster-binding protein [Gammaproteobacteria bacterium]
MTAKVKLLPSGHEFSVEPGENLLDAALRAGLSIRYSCNSGSCGECRARLVSGELGDALHHDYAFNERERADGQFLMCRTSAASDLVIEAVEARGAADVPVQTLTTQVNKLVRLSEDVMELHLRTPRSQTLWFLAGQHVRLNIPGIAPRHKSIASCPCNGMVLQFHVRRRPGDPFSDHVFTRMKVRDTIGVEGPFGSFVLDEESTRPLIFIAFETGFAPIKSLIEHAISLEMRQPIRLYWITAGARGHYLENHCRAWQDALDDFGFAPIGGSDAPGGRGTGAELAMERAVTRLLTDYPDLAGHDVYANGPEVLFAGLSAALIARGLPPDRLFVDQVQRF